MRGKTSVMQHDRVRYKIDRVEHIFITIFLLDSQEIHLLPATVGNFSTGNIEI